jgi:hypothetical protein
MLVIIHLRNVIILFPVYSCLNQLNNPELLKEDPVPCS